MTKNDLTGRTRIYSLTDHELARMVPYAQQWIRESLRTGTTEEDWARSERGIRASYRLSGFKKPIIVRSTSPLACVIAGPIAASVRASVRDSVRASVRDSVGDSVRGSVWNSVGDSVEDSVEASVGDSVRASVRDSVRASVRDSVGDSVRASVWNSVGDSVEGSVWDSVGGSVWNSVRGSVWNSVRASVRDSVQASVGAGVVGSVWNSVGDSVEDSVEASVGDSVRASVRASVRDSVWNSVRASVRDSVQASVGAGVGGSVWAGVGGSVEASVGDSVGDSVEASVEASVEDSVEASVRNNWNSFLDGHLWPSWCAYCSFLTEVCGLTLNDAEKDKLEAWRDTTSGVGWWWPHSEFCIVTPRPDTLHLDARGRMHSEIGPAIQYPDGWGIHSWHGTTVPAEWIDSPDSVDPLLALTHENIEQRRCLAEILSWDRVLGALASPPVVVDKAAPELGELIRVDLPDAPGEQFLRVRCGTGRTFVLPVPPDVRTAQQAQDWMWNVNDGEYKPETRT